jgi:hypothetical protein
VAVRVPRTPLLWTLLRRPVWHKPPLDGVRVTRVAEPRGALAAPAPVRVDREPFSAALVLSRWRPDASPATLATYATTGTAPDLSALTQTSRWCQRARLVARFGPLERARWRQRHVCRSLRSPVRVSRSSLLRPSAPTLCWCRLSGRPMPLRHSGPQVMKSRQTGHPGALDVSGVGSSAGADPRRLCRSAVAR